MDGTQVFWLQLLRSFMKHYDVVVYSIDIGKTFGFALEAIGVYPKLIDRYKYTEFLENFTNQDELDYIFLSTIRWGSFALKLNEMQIPYSWCIHEWWEPYKFEAYMDPSFHLWFDDQATVVDVKKAYYQCKSLIFCAKALYQNYSDFKHSENPKVIYYGIDQTEIEHVQKQDRVALRQRLGLNKDDLIILQVGSCYPTKGQRDSIQVVSSILQENKMLNIHLVILGARNFNEFEKNYVDLIKQQVKELGIESFVTILDSIPNAYEYFYCCDIKVLPSYKEIIPIVIYEAMAFGMPVITTNVGGLSELVVQNRTGFIFEAGDLNSYKKCLEKLIFDTNLREKMGKEGSNVLKRFSYEKMVQKYINLIEFHRMTTQNFQNKSNVQVQSEEYPLVSIIMPVYNNSCYLDLSIQSVLGQTYRNFEFLILNDGSTETEVQQILDHYQNLDQRVKLFTNNRNMGTGQSVERLLQNCKGRFVARMDSDDLIVSFKIEEQLQYLLQNQDVDIVGTFLQRLFNGKPSKISTYYQRHEEIKYLMLIKNSFPGATCMMRLDRIKKYLHYRSVVFEDYDCWLRCMYETPGSFEIRFAIIPQVLYYYRIHQENTSQIQYNKGEREISSLKKQIFLKEIYTSRSLEIDLTEELIQQFCFYFGGWFNDHQITPIKYEREFLQLYNDIFEYLTDRQEEQNIESVLNYMKDSYKTLQNTLFLE